MKTAVMCFDIGGSFIKSAVMTADDQLHLTGSLPMPTSDWDAFGRGLQQLMSGATPLLQKNSPVAISAAGVVDNDTDRILAGNIPAFNGHQVSAELSSLLRRQVVIANDADCFTLAEALQGSARGASLVLGIILGSGVGGGLVFQQQIIRGSGGLTGEWGHGPVTRTEFSYQGQQIHLPRLTCGCGQQGCLDTLGAARGLERIWQHCFSEIKDSRSVTEAWHREDPAAQQVVFLWSQLVSDVLSVVVNTLGPGKVVAGGGLASDADLITLLDREVRAKILRRCDEPLIVPAALDQQGGLIGAAMLGRSLNSAG